MDFNPVEIIATIVNIIVLFVVLRMLLFKPVGEFLEKRRQMIKEDIDSAKKDREQAEQLLTEHKEQLASSKGEATQIIEDAMRQAEERRQELLAKAQEEADQIIERAKMEIDRQREQAVEQLRTEVSVLSVQVAEKMLERAVKAEDHDKIFNQVLEELEESYAKYGS